MSRSISMGKLLPALLLVIGLSAGVVQDSLAQTGTFSVRSLGLQKCSSFLEMIQSAENRTSAVLYSQWMAGYITAKNSTLGVLDVFPIRDPLDEWVRFVTLVCMSNQDKPIVEVMEGGIKALEPYWTRAEGNSELVNVKSGESSMNVYVDYLKSSQEFLSERGYDLEVDGVFGEQTQAAFAKYKKDNGIVGPELPDSFFLIFVLAQPTGRDQ